MVTIDDAFIRDYMNRNISHNDTDDDLNSIVEYEPEEHSVTRFNIVLCELYNPHFHGITTSNVKTHYLVNSRYKQLHLKYINDVIHAIKYPYIISLWRKDIKTKTHNVYRNYNNIVSNLNFIKPEIAECIYLETHECVAILKTFWIRIIQRTWKNVMRKRTEVISERSRPYSIRIHETTGQWPKTCSVYPGLKGMLHPNRR